MIQHNTLAPALRSANPQLLRQNHKRRWLAQGILALSIHALISTAWAESAAQQLPTLEVKTSLKSTNSPLAARSSLGFLGEKSAMETPFSVSSYNEQQIANSQAKDITDVISKTDPTVFSNQASGGWNENYYIRGFNTSTRDMSMNGMFGVSPYYRASPEMFERIEVLKGPSALLNGMPPAGSVGGTINLVSKRAAETPLTRFTTTYMSDSQFGGHLDIGRRFGENHAFGARLNAVYRDGAGAVNQQDKQNAVLSLALDWRGERARASADFYRSKDRVDGVTRGINLASGLAVPKAPKANSQLNPDWGYAQSDDLGWMLRGEYDFSPAVMGYAAYAQSHSKYHYNGVSAATVIDTAGNYNSSIGQLAFEVDRKTADVGLKGRFKTDAIGHQWVINATYHQQDLAEFGLRSVGQLISNNLYHPVWTGTYIPMQYLPPITRSTLEQKSVGIADTLSFAQDRLQLTLGLRQQYITSESFNPVSKARIKRDQDHAISPGVALLYKASNQVSLYANYIEGFSMSTAPWNAANVGEFFGPYKTKQTELGIKWDLGNYNHSLSVFEIKQPNGYLDDSNIYSVDGEQRNRGVEWGFFATPIAGWRVIGGVAYVDPKLTKTTQGINQGKTATGVAKTQAKLGLEWDLPSLQGLTLSANISAVSKQYISADNQLSVAGHTIYDLGTRYQTQIADHPVMLRGVINNLSNKAYWGMPQLSNLALGAPRTLMLSASVDF